MEEIILRKLDDMFQDIREDIKRRHLEQVHQPKEHEYEDHCSSRRHVSSSLSSSLNLNRRHSIPCHAIRRESLPGRSSQSPSHAPSSSSRRGSVPTNNEVGYSQQLAGVRRSSLPNFQSGRRDSLDILPHQRRVSSASSSSGASHQRKFSRDSIDLDLVVEDASEMDPDYDDSIILEEDEALNDDEVCEMFGFNLVPRVTHGD